MARSTLAAWLVLCLALHLCLAMNLRKREAQEEPDEESEAQKEQEGAAEAEPEEEGESDEGHEPEPEPESNSEGNGGEGGEGGEGENEKEGEGDEGGEGGQEGEGGEGGNEDSPAESESDNEVDNEKDSALPVEEAENDAVEPSSEAPQEPGTEQKVIGTELFFPVDEEFPFHGGFVFDSPFFSFQQVEGYFRQLERAMERIFEQTMEEVNSDPDVYRNSTERVIEVDGRKYRVQTTVIRGGDNTNAVSIEAISAVPVDKRRKRSLF